MTTTPEVVNSPIDPMIRAKRLRDRLDAYAKNRDDFARVTLALAIELAAARDDHESNNAFSAWLATNELNDLGKTDQAAAINIGRQPREAAIMLAETKSRSLELIWDEMRIRFPIDRNTPNPAPLAAESDPTASYTPLAPVSAEPESQENSVPEKPKRQSYGVVGSGGAIVKDPGKAELIKLLEITVEEYTDLLDAYPITRQRVMKSEFAAFAKKKGNKARAVALWRLALDVVRSDRAPVLSSGATGAAIDARIFMPNVPHSICQFYKFADLAMRIDRLAALDQKAGALAASGVAMGQIHAEIDHLWRTGSNLPPSVRKKVEITADDSKARITHEVLFCGEVIWPAEGLKHVTFQDMNAGWHLMHYWARHLECPHAEQKPNEIMVQLGHLMQDIKTATSINGLVDVMTACYGAYARKHPPGTQKADLAKCIPPGLAR